MINSTRTVSIKLDNVLIFWRLSTGKGRFPDDATVRLIVIYEMSYTSGRRLRHVNKRPVPSITCDVTLAISGS